MTKLDKLAVSWAHSLSSSAPSAPPSGMAKATIVWGLICMAFGVISMACAFAAPPTIA